MCAAWPTLGGRGVGGSNHAQTQIGIHHAFPWPSESPAIARRTKQRGLTPLSFPAYLISAMRLMTQLRSRLDVTPRTHAGESHAGPEQTASQLKSQVPWRSPAMHFVQSSLEGNHHVFRKRGREIPVTVPIPVLPDPSVPGRPCFRTRPVEKCEPGSAVAELSHPGLNRQTKCQRHLRRATSCPLR